jgi:phosphatidylglycerophosphatase A
MSIASSRARLLSHPAGWLATGFGSGLSPIAPGTVGTAAALLPWLLLRELPLTAYLLVVLAAFLAGIWAAGWVIRRIGQEDPGVVVIDEFVGLWLALAAAPAGWAWALSGFALFRLFDIAKPWPASWADRKLKGGFGAMIDDAFAGLYALLALQAGAWWLN